MDKTALMSLMALPVAANIAGCAEVRPPEENSGSNTVPPAVTPEPSAMPNILFVIADDLSYPHTSAYGNTMVSTPGFDRVARDGALFNNHYVTSPGSSPSRASILTGLYPWQIEEAGTHASSFPARYTCFPEVLQKAGYLIGYTGKGWSPGKWDVSGRPFNPAGPVYNDKKLTPPYSGISKIDYAGNFKAFLEEREEGQPFYFWLGGNEPHRTYQSDSWSFEGLSPDNAEVPGFLPETDDVRKDLLNYAVEIEWFDNQLVKCLDELESRGELDNTIVIVTADNGMPFPHAKCNCYDAGIHVPLAICWGDRIEPQVIEKLTSSVDFFPTFMDAAGLESDIRFSGQSLLPLLTEDNAGYTADAVYAGRERHSSSRYDNLGYPIRSIRQDNWLLIWNMHPERWPAGDPQSMKEDGTLNAMHKAYFDIDGSPSKTFLVNNYTDPDVRPYFDAAVAKRGEYELYNLSSDPECMDNLAEDSGYRSILESLIQKLETRLVETGDTRMGANPDIWETYPRLDGSMRYFPEPVTEEEGDHIRAGWTVSTNTELFEENGNNYTEGLVDGVAGSFLGLVKPGKKQNGVTNNDSHIEFIIDMKEPKTVDYFRIRHKRTGNVQLRWRKFSKIEGSNDGISFFNIADDVEVTGYDSSDAIMTGNIRIPETVCRYLKFYGTSDCWDTSNGNSVQISELFIGKSE